MKRLLAAVVFTVLLTLAAFADIRLPDTPKPAKETGQAIDSGLVIRLSDEATETKLIIPKSQLKDLRAALDDMDDISAENAAVTSSSGNFTRTQTIISGLFMSLAFVFGGVWFARSRKADSKSGKTIIAGAILLMVGSMATLVFANAGPPSTLRRINGNLFDKKVFGGWRFASGSIKVEVSNTARGFELIVPDKADNTKSE